MITAHESYVTRTAPLPGNVYVYDKADDGPEVALILMLRDAGGADDSQRLEPSIPA